MPAQGIKSAALGCEALDVTTGLSTPLPSTIQ